MRNFLTIASAVLIVVAIGIAAVVVFRGPGLPEAPPANAGKFDPADESKAPPQVASEKVPPNTAASASHADLNPVAAEATQLQVDAEAEDQAADLMSLDPRLDGWDIEYFNEIANGQLKGIAHLIEAGTLDAETVSNFVAEDCESAPLVPQDATPVYQRGELQVVRGDSQPEVELAQGRSGFVAALKELTRPLAGAEHAHVKFKVVRVTPGDDYVETQQLYSASGFSAEGGVEQHAFWTIRWTKPLGDDLPLISRIESQDFQQTIEASAEHTLFTDCTNAVFAGLPSEVASQMLIGTDRWIQRIEHYLEPYQFGHNGIAIGDVNGDGLEDVYSCQLGGLPNRLWLANEDGTVREASAESGVDVLDNTRSALLVDFDNDGDQDLALTLPRMVLIYENDGSGKFKQVAQLPEVNHGFSLAAADYDQDGDLDLYACVYFAQKATASELPIPMPVYDARNGGRNVLFRNEGDWKFTDATREVGLDDDNSRFSFAVVWEDFDNDGDQDLFVANDFGNNDYYENDAGHFREASAELHLVDGAFGMGAAAADYDRDGWVDIYKANMFSSAGNRVTNSSQFMPEATEEHKDRFRHMARGNTLFHNRKGKFEDVSTESGAAQGRWSWGSLFLDINNDGWDDLLVTNGFVTGADLDDL